VLNAESFLKTYQASGSAQRLPREPRQAGNGATVAAAACVAGRSGAWPISKRVAAGKGLAEARRVGAKSNVARESRAGRRARAATLFLFAVKINFKRLDHVQVCIPRGAEAEAREFYGGLLGLQEIEKPAELRENGGMWYSVADVQLHVGVEDAVAPSKRHPAFEVERVEEVRAFLEQNGVRTRSEPRLPGIARFSLFDPFGNRIELMEKTTRDGAEDKS